MMLGADRMVFWELEGLLQMAVLRSSLMSAARWVKHYYECIR